MVFKTAVFLLIIQYSLLKTMICPLDHVLNKTKGSYVKSLKKQLNLTGTYMNKKTNLPYNSMYYLMNPP